MNAAKSSYFPVKTLHKRTVYEKHTDVAQIDFALNNGATNKKPRKKAAF